jgi:hypothetical protein
MANIKSKMKRLITIFFLGIFSFSFSQEIELKNLKVEILKTNDVSSTFGGANPFRSTSMFTKKAKEGMTFIMVKLKLKNEGKESLNVNFNKFQITDNDNIKYEFSFIYGIGFPSTKTIKLKPGKKVKKFIYFEFPKEKELNELVIGKVKYNLK